MESKLPIKREGIHMHMISRIFISQREVKEPAFAATVEIAYKSKDLALGLVSLQPRPQ